MYKDVLLVCKTKLDTEGSACVLDLPFPIFHQQVVQKGKEFHCYPLPKEIAGQEVLAVVTVSTEERTVNINGVPVVAVPNSAPDADGYKGKITDFKTDVRVIPHWATTKETAYATSTVTVDDVTKEETIESIPYSEADKLDLAPFCVSSAIMTKDEVDYSTGRLAERPIVTKTVSEDPIDGGVSELPK